jgi:hypothetical protein
MATTKKPTLTPDQYIEFDLLSRPHDAASKDLYRIKVPFFGDGESVQDFIDLQKDLAKIFSGQNLDTGAQMINLTKAVLQGKPLHTFNTHISLRNGNGVDDYKFAINELAKSIFPNKALKRQKRYMRRFLSKPSDIPMRDYVYWALAANHDLAFYPDADNSDRFPLDELQEIIEFGIPYTYLHEYEKLRFDPRDRSLEDLIEFCIFLEHSLFLKSEEAAAKMTNQTPREDLDNRGDSQWSDHCMKHDSTDNATDDTSTSTTDGFEAYNVEELNGLLDETTDT